MCFSPIAGFIILLEMNYCVIYIHSEEKYAHDYANAATRFKKKIQNGLAQTA